MKSNRSKQGVSSRLRAGKKGVIPEAAQRLSGIPFVSCKKIKWDPGQIALRFSGMTALLLGLFLSNPAYADIPIGLVAPLSGQYAVNGEQLRHGFEEAIANINAAGGVLGQQLKPEVADDACDPKQAVAAANKLANLGVKLVVGHYCSGSAIPASKVFMEEKIVLVTPGATNPKLTDEGGPGVFRVCGRDDKQAGVIAVTISKEFNGKKIALLHDKSAYGRGLADEVKKYLNAAGMKETLFEAYTPGEKDYSSLVTLLKQNAIDVVFIGGYHTEGGLIARQLRAADSKAQIFAGDAFVTNEYWSIAGPAAEGTLMSFAPDPRKKTEAAAVVKAFQAKGIDPEGYTLYSYAAVQVLSDALKGAGAADFAKLTPYMHATSFQTVLGPIAFDAKGDIKNPEYVIYRWHDGKYEERAGTPALEPKVCTMDAKACPDGSYVSRTGPNCEFAACLGKK